LKHNCIFKNTNDVNDLNAEQVFLKVNKFFIHVQSLKSICSLTKFNFMNQQMMRLILLACVLAPIGLYAQKKGDEARLISGPMLGGIEHREAKIWIMTACTQKLNLYYRQVGGKKTFEHVESTVLAKKPCEPKATTFTLALLEPGVTYEYYIIANGKRITPATNLQFTTRTLWEWRTDPPLFSFLAGSCLYINDSIYDRPGRPYGQSLAILQTMAKMPADMMLWLGDNNYTREVDYSSVSGLAYRYMHSRTVPALQPLLAAMPNYAIWDDHDFGPNDAGKTYPLKKQSRDLFIEYWANPSYGENEEGIYTTFTKADAQFFLLDGRYYRDENEVDELQYPQKSQLGERQLDWFLQALQHSRATFKFVCIGGQFLNEHTNKESYNYFKNERKKIIDYIVKNKISGVVFLSGDRHHTELIQNTAVKADLGYVLHDLTSSALTSGPNTMPEENNPMRIPSTLVTENNFCKLTLSGAKKDRILTITCYNSDGKELWRYAINEKDLKANR
jgi:alkaline phosphatase D